MTRSTSDYPEPVATVLTAAQKLSALGSRFYSGLPWPKLEAGLYYTTSRDDLELYMIVEVTDQHVYTRYCAFPESQISEWPIDEFTDKGFGPKRVYVGPWVLGLDK
jgi:hypothetical protein